METGLANPKRIGATTATTSTLSSLSLPELPVAYSFCGWCSVSQLRRLWTRGSDIDLAFRVGAVAGATAILVHGFVDYFLEFTPLNLIIWASFGLIIAGDRLAKESDPAERNLPSLRGG